MEVSIDKICLIHTIQEKEHYNAILQFMHGFIKEYKGKGHYYWKTKYSTNIKVNLDKQCDMVIRAGITHSKLYAKFEFNAGKISAEGWEYLCCLFELIFDDGYKTAYENFRVDYLEIAADFKGIEFSQVNAIDNRVKEFSDLYKSVGSIYYGSKKSKRGFIIYDKAKQLKEVKGVHLDHPLLRVECRLRLPNTKLKDIGEIKNPFIPLRIFDVSKKHPLATGLLWKKFKELIQESGCDAQAAYLSLSPIERQAIDYRVFLCRSYWWDPIKVWEQANTKFTLLSPT